MAAGTYIKFITSNGTVLTGTAGTQWAEAVDPGYAHMPILDSGLAAAVDAAAARGNLQIEVAGYDDPSRPAKGK